MKKTVVVYQSRYGATKRYAEWIARALSCDLFERAEVKPEDLAAYETVVYGGGLYAGGVAGMSLITRSPEAFSGKNLVLFTCGLADPEDPENVRRIREGVEWALPEPLRGRAQLFHLRGAMDYAKLGAVHRMMMAMVHRAVKSRSKNGADAEARAMLDTYGKAVDFIDFRTAEPLADFVRGL